MHKQDYKVDFMGLISVCGANPNGDPLCNGRPRIDSAGYGIISDVCLKRKLRNTLAQMKIPIFVRPVETEKITLEKRASIITHKEKAPFIAEACRRWFDVRAFGQVFSFAGRRESCAVRGPVSIQHAFSVDPIVIEELPITRCINSSSTKGRASDTMGLRTYVQYGLYIMKGSICAGLAEKNGFIEADAIILRKAIMNMFAYDASTARPSGSMHLERLYWWNHHSMCGDLPSASVFNTIRIHKAPMVDIPLGFSDYIIEEDHIPGLTPRIFDTAIPAVMRECGSE